MLFSDTVGIAMKAIFVNRTRSLLTMLGIIIGVASVVLMVSVGRTFQEYILSQVESIGSNMVEVIPVGLQKFGGNLESLSYDDYLAIKSLSTVESVTPVIIVGKPVTYGKEEITPLIFGAYEEFSYNYGLNIDRGRPIGADDEKGASSVVVIGSQAAEDLFGNTEPLGKRLTIGEATFTVIGVLEKKGSLILQDFDKMILMPFSAARALTGQRTLSYMTMSAVGDPELAKQDITDLLRQRHRIKNPFNDPDKDDFIVQSAEQTTETIGAVTLGLTVFLALVAGISLLVGGIGIMNIMLVSVTERTKEIGLRKAVGAKKQDILLQFLFEAVSLTMSGGFIGLILGIFSGWFLTQVAAKFLGSIHFILSGWSVILALCMAVGTGLIFGIYPAKKAANLSPMEALRYE
jgi:putative ABC transport system permease protein